MIAGTLTVGVLTELLAFMAILQQPVRQIGMIVNSTARGSVSGARVFELIDLDPAIREACEAARGAFEDAGAEVVEVGLPHAPHGVAVYYVVAIAEAGQVHLAQPVVEAAPDVGGQLEPRLHGAGGATAAEAVAREGNEFSTAVRLGEVETLKESGARAIGVRVFLGTPKLDTSVNASLDLADSALQSSAIGVSVQAYSANLDEYAAVNPTSAGLALLDDADAAAQRTTLAGVDGSRRRRCARWRAAPACRKRRRTTTLRTNRRCWPR